MWSPSTKTSAARPRRRLGGPRVADDEVDAVREAVAVERRAQLGVQPRPAHVGAERDVEVVRPQLGPVGERAREHQRRAALEAADLGDRGARGRVLREPVEQRRLVELERRDPVAELVRGEEEGEILEAVERLRPALDARVPLQAGIRLDGGVDEVLADPRPPCGAERPLHEVAQHAGTSTPAFSGSSTPAAGRGRGRRRAAPRRPRARRRRRAVSGSTGRGRPKETSARAPIAAAPTASRRPRPPARAARAARAARRARRGSRSSGRARHRPSSNASTAVHVSATSRSSAPIASSGRQPAPARDEEQRERDRDADRHATIHGPR